MFVGSVLEAGGTLRLPEGEAHHVFRVLRGHRGDSIEVADVRGRLFGAELRSGVEAVVLEELEAPEEAEIVLYQSVPKGGRMEFVVEKATEVGATSIVPLLAERGVVRPRESKVGRWRRVAEAAARQSLRVRVPEVEEPVSFVEAVRDVRGEGVLLHNAYGLARLEEVVAGSPVALFVGPEGGWSESEMRLAEESGVPAARLGPYRLRSETAGVVGVARAWAALEGRVENLRKEI